MRRTKKYDHTPFDRFRIPPKQNPFFLPFIWLLCQGVAWKNNLRITRTNMKGLKPPYLVLATHQAFMDFCIPPLVFFPHASNSVSELEGFEYYGEWLYRQAGCLGTRKFTNDLALVRNIRRVIQRQGILILYPEARYANVGTQSAIPPSVGKLAKLLKVPVVTLNMHGNYLQSPIWNLRKRKGVPLLTEVEQLLTPAQLDRLSAEDIQQRIQQVLSYDEYAWQKEQGISIRSPFRCEGLHLVLYQCRSCHKENQMLTKGARLYCEHCQAVWEMTEYGELRCLEEGGEAPNVENTPLHIPDWYEWQRAQVIQEIENGAYALNCQVIIEALPNARNFVPMGQGELLHTAEGFCLSYCEPETGNPCTLFFPAKDSFSIHTEYDYRGKGPCVTLSTLDNTFFLFPLDAGVNVTKIQFATERLYQLALGQG